jgi:hypothetical protein
VILKNGLLVLLADSPVWASRLRYASHDLQRQLILHGWSIRRTQSKVSIPKKLTEYNAKIRPTMPLSQANAELLRSVAESIQNKELKDALIRLSTHTTNG